MKPYIIKFNVLFIFIAFALFSHPAFSQTQLQQFQNSFTIGNKFQGALIIVGEGWHAQPINNLLKEIEIRTNDFYKQLMPNIPNSAISKLNRMSKGKHELPLEIADAIRNAIGLASWSKGAFDITGGNYKKVEVDKDKPVIRLGADNIKFDLSSIIEGVLTDYMIKIAKEANANNAIARVGMVFRSMGVSDNGPWKIQIQDSEGTFAHHAMNLTVKDAGVSANSVDRFLKTSHLSPAQKQSQCKGVVIIAKEATVAEGVSNAVFKLGPISGLEFINGIPNLRGLIVDLNGRFYRSNNF